MTRTAQPRGAALIAALFVSLVLSLLGTVSFNLASQEVESVKAVKEEAAVQHLAEAGIDLALELFHDPLAAPADAAGSLFQKRLDLGQDGASFFDSQGISQFRGTAASPDLIYDAADSAHDRLLNDPGVGWFRALRDLGRILKLKVYGPARPGLLCTIEVTAAGVSGLTRTVAVQLGARTIPPLRAGVQIGGSAVDPNPARALPLWVHWGDLKIKEAARLAKIEDLPIKTFLAPVTALPYADMVRREDRWLNVAVGGAVSFLPSTVAPVPPPPSNVLALQEPLPGVKEDRWEYERMKSHAVLYGAYYVRNPDGLLYRNGTIEPGRGITADALFRSEAIGDHRGLVFIDTLDQQPPRADNLGQLTVEVEFAEGLFLVNAHVRLKPKGMGWSVPALSPPNEGTNALGSRVPLELAGIHLRGVLSVAGDLVFEGRPRVYGGVMIGGRVVAEGATPGMLEVWSDHELRQGLVRGMPLVFVAPGTWIEK